MGTVNLLYALCNQTVTVYNVVNQQGQPPFYRRTVIKNGARMDFNRQWQQSKTGATGGTSFLLVIPQGADGKTFVQPAEYAQLIAPGAMYTLNKNDKVMLGEGPEINDPKTWGEFIPAKVDGLGIIMEVDPKAGLGGKIVHVEAGGK